MSVQSVRAILVFPLRSSAPGDPVAPGDRVDAAVRCAVRPSFDPGTGCRRRAAGSPATTWRRTARPSQREGRRGAWDGSLPSAVDRRRSGEKRVGCQGRQG
ncbi:MAG: hypothetical protein AVDCRST_MAG33-2168 [uncultured Thermomicrobiales bacterium]|uniref:Uncharacterized protein n=1 Tax=uncultured Thermomicrobiales bacterium TaxID=1645740 RepID=A0A6J4V862_9BACT|nr:MAG: hypothetical protein AVDCRST_MAG33-2168 [uncultured Thermomicrobiales bacterium]